MNPNLAALMLFLLLAGSLGTGVLAFAGSSSSKKTVKRLDAIRERHLGPREGLAKVRKRIFTDRSSRFDLLKSLMPRRAELAFRLEQTGRKWSVGGYGATCAAIAFGLFALVWSSGGGVMLALMIGVAVGAGLPHLAVGRMIARRAKAFNVRLPDAIDLLVRGLRSGLPVTESLGIVGREVAEPVGGEFRTVADRIRIGEPMEAALAEAARRVRTPEFNFFVIALAIQRETGGNLAETLGNLSDVLRKRAQMKLKVNAMSSEAKASAYIVGALPILVFVLVWFMNPAYVAKFFTDARLMMTGGGGLVWMGIGAAIMAKMVRFEI